MSLRKNGAVSAPFHVVYHCLLDGFSVVSVWSCPFQSHSGSKVGQKTFPYSICYRLRPLYHSVRAYTTTDLIKRESFRNSRIGFTQPCGAATPEEADARCKRAHPLPPALLYRLTSTPTEIPLVCPWEPLCAILRGRAVSLAPEMNFEPFSSGFAENTVPICRCLY